MKVLYLLPLLLILLAPCAQALQEPNITFIPPMFSKDASVVIIADPSSNASVRVSWNLPAAGAFGLFPKIEGKFYCYFSNSDPKSTCGPSPFTQTTIGLSPYELTVNAVDGLGNTAGSTATFHTGSMTLLPLTTVEDKTLYIRVGVMGGFLDALKYSIYRTTDLAPVVTSRDLTYSLVEDKWSGDYTLPYGEYYLALWGYIGSESSPTNFGGNLLRINVGEPEEIIEEVDVLTVDEIDLDILINAGQHFEQTGFKVTNVGTETLKNLSFSIPASLRPYLGVRFDSTYMVANDTTLATITLDGVSSAMSIDTVLDVYSDTAKVGKIPVKMSISVIGAAVGCEGVPDGSLCMGGVCCNQNCVKGGVCCSTLDCRVGETCSNYECVSAAARMCTAGTCHAGASGADCPSGTDYTYETCTTTLGEPGVCCQTADPCKGLYDGETCPGGICCSEKCVVGGECCSDFDCDLGETCDDNICVTEAAAPTLCSAGMCYAGTIGADCPSDRTYTGERCTTTGGQGGVCCESAYAPPAGGGVDITLILVIVIIAVAGVGAYFALTKMKGGGGRRGKKLEKELEEEY